MTTLKCYSRNTRGDTVFVDTSEGSSSSGISDHMGLNSSQLFEILVLVASSWQPYTIIPISFATYLEQHPY